MATPKNLNDRDNKQVRLSYMTRRQRQIIVGTLLGDASISVHGKARSCNMKIGHCKSQKDYLEWKKKELDGLFQQSEANITCPGPTSFQNSQDFYSYTSGCHQELSFLNGLLYRKIRGKRTKVISWRVLDMLGIVGILVWYLDDGTMVWPDGLKRSLNFRLATYCFGRSGNKIIRAWFWKRYGIRVLLTFDCIHDSWYLRARKIDTKKFLDLISGETKTIPQCMKYKFDPTTSTTLCRLDLIGSNDKV